MGDGFYHPDSPSSGENGRNLGGVLLLGLQWACHIMGNISEHGNYDWPDGGATLSGTGHLPGSIGKPRAIAC
jgi:hypothetical protein